MGNSLNSQQNKFHVQGREQKNGVKERGRNIYKMREDKM